MQRLLVLILLGALKIDGAVFHRFPQKGGLQKGGPLSYPVPLLLFLESRPPIEARQPRCDAEDKG